MTVPTEMTPERVREMLRGNPGILEARARLERLAPDLARAYLAEHEASDKGVGRG